MAIEEAQRIAEESELDLVEIVPNADPPVCRVMDYGKFVFEESKKKHAAKKKQKQIQVKEVKFRPGTDEGDYQVKLRNLVRFLDSGDKAKVRLRFRSPRKSTWLAMILWVPVSLPGSVLRLRLEQSAICCGRGMAGIWAKKLCRRWASKPCILSGSSIARPVLPTPMTACQNG